MEKTVGERIKELRVNAGLKQSELADKVGFTSQTVSNWESGTREPDIAALSKLSSLFNVTLDYLLLGKKDEEKITLDDMDNEKRLSWIIKRDDIDNFKKYGYQESPYLFGRTQDYMPNTRYGSNYAFRITSLNLVTWKEIINAKAYKLFNLVLDEMMKRNAQSKCWLAFTVYECLDMFVEAVIDNDRDDVLAALGVKYFKLGDNSQREVPMLLGPTENASDKQAYAMSKETLRYFFEKKEKSPKSYKYITSITLLDVSINKLSLDKNASQKSYVTTYLEFDLLNLAIEFGDKELVNSIMTVFETANQVTLDLLKPERRDAYDPYGFHFQLIKGSFVCQYVTNHHYGEHQIVARLFIYPFDLINRMIVSGDVDLGKKMLNENKKIQKENIQRLKTENGADIDVYTLNDKEIERMIKLNSDKTSEKEKSLLNCVNDIILVPQAVKNLRDVKYAKELLDKYYMNYYEFAYESISKKNVKELLQVLLDNEFDNLAQKLLNESENYDDFLRNCWRIFNSREDSEIYKNHKLFFKRQWMVDVKADPTLRMHDVETEAVTLGGNRIIDLIKKEKENIFEDVVHAIEAEKKAKEEAAERAKIVKGLTREYFEDLLEKDNKEMFIIKLCSLFDAILKFDHHLEGEDFSERMNKYFANMNENAPQSRTMDDGWGYQVPDTKYEEEVVVPEQETISRLSDIFNRLRIQRNNIAHSESKKVRELSIDELNECLDYVLPKK